MQLPFRGVRRTIEREVTRMQKFVQCACAKMNLYRLCRRSTMYELDLYSYIAELLDTGRCSFAGKLPCGMIWVKYLRSSLQKGVRSNPLEPLLRTPLPFCSVLPKGVSMFQIVYTFKIHGLSYTYSLIDQFRNSTLNISTRHIL